MSHAEKAGRWTAASIGDQTGKLTIITGACSGIGFEAARALGHHGATVILACRSQAQGEDAARQIGAERPPGNASAMRIDLADLASVRHFADDFRAQHGGLDLLILNAGVMALPKRQLTADGFEAHFGINHLAHFALTGLLIDTLTARQHSRVVTVASGAHRLGRLDFSDLQSERKYVPALAYATSKLANLLFAYELNRRLATAALGTISVAAHPGWTRTRLQRHSRIARWLNPLLAQSAAMGALPVLRAATDLTVKGGEYYGPGGPFELRGYPVRVRSSPLSYDRAIAQLLWQRSIELTGIDPGL